ncbi:LysR substrate-binding domain-containing protein [Nesterenkonia sp. HG001]|uniref:LysR substrate-binding domain-containing protein n=1 Tax=Nesterenkonia sp. HG001 TaxID=2983207 RepID=UPI002ACBEE64|nr:LysR substrate-binding domain-containing protein [Nesterenkonia sp. HG001]
MEHRHLELLRELAARGTLAAVATATHRSPSAVSQHLRAAERDLGVRLVEPASRTVRLTPEGELLAAGAADIAERMADLQAQLDARRGAPAGTVTLGTLPSAGEALMPGLLARTAGTGIAVDLDDFDLAEADFAARAHDSDIVIAHSLSGDAPTGTKELNVTVVAHEPLVVALPADHPMAGAEAIGPEEAHALEWIGVPPGYPFDTVLVALENELGAPLSRRVRLRDNRLVESLVGAGMGAALLPGFTTRPREGLVLRPLTGVRAQRSIVALSRPDRHARLAVRTVTRLLQETGAALEDAHREPSPGEVAGPVVDDETRCVHYASALDVVAIRFHCCGRWYPCLHCHAGAEDHSVLPWPADRHDAEALLCGVCRRRFSIAEYLQVEGCTGCGAAFNPGCSRHHPVYFEMGPPS